MWRSIVGALKAGLEIVSRWMRRQDRADAESAGAAKQVAENQKEAIDAKDEQLEEAAQHRPGDAVDKLRDGRF